LSLKGSHSSHEPKVPQDSTNSLKIKVSKVIHNVSVKKSETSNQKPQSNVIPPRPRSGCGSFKSKRKSGSKPSGAAVGNFFISQNKQHLFLNEDDVDTYITYPHKDEILGSD
tara:strand:- start:451 stop:786 length:336 start_codon:yes stop_codon:yes gene_type:complete